jgi:hypothetical protein
MQGYSKGTMVPFITVYYNVEEESTMQGYSKGSQENLITVHYNG